MGDMDDIEREFREKVRRIRPYAAFFDWPVKETKELGVVKTLLENLKAGDPLGAVREVRPGRPDPPDAIGVRDDGVFVALEVTELVDQDVASRNVRAARETVGLEPIERIRRTVYRDYSEDEFVAAVEARLREKDGKVLHGGPFPEYVVILHTDEVAPSPADAKRWLGARIFEPLSQITGAYLLFSYDPTIEAYPYIRLKVRGGAVEMP